MTEDDVTKLEVVELRRNPWMTALSCGPWALVPLALAAGHPFSFFVFHLAIVGLIAFVGVWQRMPYARRVLKDATVDREALHVGHEAIPRSAIQKAELVPTTDSPVVRVERAAAFDVNLVMRDDDEAHALLTALGFDVTQRTAAYKIRSLALVRNRWAPVVIAFAAFFLMRFFGPHVAPAALPLLFVAMAAIYYKRSKLVVGADGLWIEWLWIREFVPMKEIDLVTDFELSFGNNNKVRGVEIVKTDGTSIKLPLGEANRAIVKRRVRDVFELARAERHVDDEALVLVRGDLPLRDWIDRLKAMGAGATATLRTQAVMPDRLWRVAADTAQPAITRAAAAVALAPTLDESGRVRLAELARATAAPKLRVALERVAEEADDDTVEEALHELGE